MPTQKNTTTSTDVDRYLADVPEPARSTLETLRATIKSIAPEAEELISYKIPSFRYKGMLVGYAAFKAHCSLLVMNSKLVVSMKAELKNYKTSAGTIQFAVDKPLPAALVKKIVKARMKENEELEKARKNKK